MKKKILALVLSLALCFSLVPMGSAAGSAQEEMAGKLKSLGLFLGDEQGNFNLDKAPTRVEALVMLVRALGQDGEARAAGKSHPFADVPEWADGYVSLAYAKGYTKGVSDTQFGADSTASCEMYLTFLLRALGYHDGAEGDFTYDQPFLLAYEAGILPCSIELQDFRRAHVVEATVAALFAGVKGSDQALHETLEAAGAFSAQAFADTFPGDPFAEEKALAAQVDKALQDQLAQEELSEDAARARQSMLVSYSQADGVTTALAAVETATAQPGENGVPSYSGSFSSRQLTFSADGELLDIQTPTKLSVAGAARYQLFQDKFSNFLYQVVKQEAADKLQGGEPSSAYAAAVAALQAHGEYSLRQSFESDYGTVFLYDLGVNPNGSCGYLTFIAKAPCAKGEGATVGLPHPRHSLWTNSKPPQTAQLSEDGRTFTYAYHYDEPIMASGRIERAAGDFVYTLDLTTGEVAAQEPQVPQDANTHAASLERVVNEAGYVTEQQLDAPTCTVVLRYFQGGNGQRSYFLELVFKAGVDGMEEGTALGLPLPVTRDDGTGEAGFPVYYTDRAPDTLELSPDGSTLSYTYTGDIFFAGNSKSAVIDLKTGIQL